MKSATTKSGLGKLDKGMASTPKAGTKPLNVATPQTPTADQYQYQAKADAHTLMEAHRVKKDKARHGRALKHLKSMRDDAHNTMSDGDADDQGNKAGNKGNYGV